MSDELQKAVGVLLLAIVGYLAMDRQEKDVSNERSKAFDRQFAK